MDDAELPTCAPEDWQAEIRDMLAAVKTQLGRVESQAIKTNGRVGRLEDRMEIADRERTSLTAQVETIRSQALPEIDRIVRSVIGDELDRRELVAKAAKQRALEERFGADLEDDLAQMERIKRFGITSASKFWYVLLSGSAGALLMLAGRLLT